jgi:signal transduction histidine kinase
VVEDREDDFRYLTCVLERSRTASYELEWAPTYEAGLEALRRGGHDVGLFDYTLGGGTGIDLLREAQAQGCSMPILLLTGHDSPEIDEAASSAGAVDFLCKAGLDHVQLERAIRYAVRQAEMRTVLRKSQQQLELFMRSVPCATAIRDENGEIIFQNDLFARYFGSEQPDAAIGADVFSTAEGPEPRPYVTGDRHWLVSSFPMIGDGRRQLDGFTAVDITDRVNAENERRRATQLLDSIMRNLPVIAGRLDREGRIVEAQGHGMGHSGLQPAQLVGRVFTDLFPQTAEPVRQAIGGESANFTLSGREDDVEWHADFFVMFDAAQGEGATFFGRDTTDRRWLERRLLTVTDAEQQRIGADLHDGLGQQLTGLACMAAALRDRLKNGAPAESQQSDMIARLANEAIAQSRALARGLCPVQLEKAGLILALEDLAGQAQMLHGVECRFEVKGAPPRCDHLTAMHLYRITQEAIHNAVRHGKARRILITLTSRKNQHRLVISDDGQGFDADSDTRATGSGLRLMGYRAAMIGGMFSAESKPGRGTRIACHFTSFPTHYENDHTRKDSNPDAGDPDAEGRQIAC